MRIKSSFYLLDITSGNPLKVNRCFGGTCLHLQGRKISQARNRREAGSKLQAAFLLGLFFDHENEGNGSQTVGRGAQHTFLQIKIKTALNQLEK
jgi:hypothetical protein